MAAGNPQGTARADSAAGQALNRGIRNLRKPEKAETASRCCLQHLIHVNTGGTTARRMSGMGNPGIKYFGMVQRLALAVVLLCAPLAAAASGPAAPAPACLEQTAITGHCTNRLPDITQRHSATTGAPLHCCLQPQQPQAIGLARASTDDKPQLPACIALPPAAVKVTALLTELRLDVPVHVPPRFILFGNFRS